MIPCVNHPAVEASGTCTACGRPFCEGCLVEYLGSPHCGACRDLRLRQLVPVDPRDIPEPPVWRWQKVYCIALAVVYLLVGAAGIAVFFFAGSIPNEDPTEMRVMGVVYGVLGGLFFLPFAAGPFLPRRPWAWIYHIVLIAIGMTSACCIPACIPLLIFWLKPETKAFFGYRV